MCNVNKILFIKDKKNIYIHISIFNNRGCAHYFGPHLNYPKDSSPKNIQLWTLLDSINTSIWVQLLNEST